MMAPYMVSIEYAGFSTNATFDDPAAAKLAFEQAQQSGVMRITLAKIGPDEHVDVIATWVG